ncbi:MAG TPA: MarR family winged helix-turn-helix transcriptional regulator [Acidimicrobiales bacterium]|nr:MarR family winged helix-turn-helix transcriptional regulator [Acidimicrobiales bacterium]
MPETDLPIGLFLTRTARGVSRAFEAALAGVGGSLATWLVLASLMGGLHRSQRELARDIGIEGPTLTHHLNRMEAAGLVRRARNPANRRVHDVELTPEGDAVFLAMVSVVADFDRRLRDGFSERELATLRLLLQRLGDNATSATSQEGAHA